MQSVSHYRVLKKARRIWAEQPAFFGCLQRRAFSSCCTKDAQQAARHEVHIRLDPVLSAGWLCAAAPCWLSQGFASGDPTKDAQAITTFLNDGHQVACAQSYAKNMGLYGQRVGCLRYACAARPPIPLCLGSACMGA